MQAGVTCLGAAEGNGVFVTVGKKQADTNQVGTILTFEIGGTWRPRLMEFEGVLLADVVFGNGRFVACGESTTPSPAGIMLVSSNGFDWTQLALSGSPSPFIGLAYNGTQFVAVGSGGSILTSTDGLSWETTPPVSPSEDLVSVAAVNGSFVAIGAGVYTYVSTDGLTWTHGGNGVYAEAHAIAYGEAHYVYAGGGNASGAGAGAYVATFSDLDTYFIETDRSPFTAPENSYARLSSIAFGNNRFVAVGGLFYTEPSGQGLSYVSTDTTNWTAVVVSGTAELNRVVFVEGMFVAVGDDGTVVRSSDGLNWSSVPEPDLNGVAYGNGRYVAVGSDGQIEYSDDGAHWNSTTAATTNALFGVTWGLGQWVAVGAAGTVVHSTDGAAWSTPVFATGQDLYAVTCWNNLFEGVGDSAPVVKSPDGITWTATPSPAPLYALVGTSNFLVAAGGKPFAAGGSADWPGNSFVSANGTDWDWWSLSGVDSDIYGVALGQGLFVAVGNPTFGGPFDPLSWKTTIATSPDATNWTPTFSVPISGPVDPHTTDGIYLYGVAYGNGAFVTVGQEAIGWGGMNGAGAILSSTDGFKWRRRVSATSYPLTAVTYGNGHFIAVGYTGVILQSQAVLRLVPASGQGGGIPYRLNISGPDGQTYAVEASNDLVTWTNLTAGTLTNGTGQFEDPGSINAGYRFYRTSVP